MAGGAGHEEKDDVLHPRREMRLLGRERIGGRMGDAATGKLIQRDRAESDAAFLEEPAASEIAGRNVAVEVGLGLAVHGLLNR
jgi:hypothetical protein